MHSKSSAQGRSIQNHYHESQMLGTSSLMPYAHIESGGSKTSTDICEATHREVPEHWTVSQCFSSSTCFHKCTSAKGTILSNFPLQLSAPSQPNDRCSFVSVSSSLHISMEPGNRWDQTTLIPQPSRGVDRHFASGHGPTFISYWIVLIPAQTNCKQASCRMLFIYISVQFIKVCQKMVDRFSIRTESPNCITEQQNAG